jgi:sulfofructose kinase
MPSTTHVFVGVATYDTIALVDRYPDADERIVATELMHAGGGPAATAAVAAARLGVPVAFVGSVGDDADADAILESLTAEGVDVSGVTRIPASRSAASVVIVDASQATRAIINRPPQPLQLDGRAHELLAAARWVHVDQSGWGAVSEWWRAAPHRPSLSVDAGNPIEGFTPDGVDLYVPTISALRARYGEGDAEHLLAAAIAEGARTVVATAGGSGSYALGTDEEFVHIVGERGALLSTLGAGDVFHGALLAALHHGFGLGDCLRYANRVAFCSCQGLDGRSAIPTHTEVVAALDLEPTT